MENRKCTKCGMSKPQLEFFVKTKMPFKLHTQCKSCYSEHRKTYYKEHYQKYHKQYLERAKVRRELIRSQFRKRLTDYLADKACEVCGENDMRVLEFDHIAPKDKLFTISQAVKLGYSWQDVEKEIKKCRILCSNCHRKHTSTQFNWYKSII